MKKIFKKMIENSKNKACIISFGLGMTTFSCSVGDDVPIRVSGLYNQNEFILQQNETGDFLVNYFYEDAPNNFIINSQTTATYQGILNGKPKYHLEIQGITYMLWYNINTDVSVPPYPFPEFHYNQWVLTDIFVNMPATIFVRSSKTGDDFYPPLNTSFQMTSTLLIDINITNITQITNVGGFNFPAVQTKEIQVEMQNKNGTILKSNKIQLNIIQYLYGSNEILWGDQTLTFND